MKKLLLFSILLPFFSVQAIHVAGAGWFQTWDRPEYLEWAKARSYGYLLHIIRKEPTKFLTVQAKLLLGETGLPGFEVLKELSFATEEESVAQVAQWEAEDAVANAPKEEL